MKQECIECHSKTINKLIVKFNPETESANLLTEKFKVLLTKDYNNPYLATEIHRLARVTFNNNDLYKQEKEIANMLLFERYEQWKNTVQLSSNSFCKAALLAVAGNIIDYGAHSVPENIEKQINELLKQGLSIDETKALQKAVAKAKSVLYLGDNAGEIVFDRLFIEQMNHPNLTYVVRDRPVINDVTFNDIQQVKMAEVCRVISNGYDAPSTLLDFCSAEFVESYNSADLIISKGQGNFEGLMNSNNPKIFFLLMAKCRPMAELLGVKKGQMLVKQLKTQDYVI